MLDIVGYVVINTKYDDVSQKPYWFVCETPDGNVLYFAREKKGHTGVKGTPVENYRGIFEHDHDVFFTDMDLIIGMSGPYLKVHKGQYG